MYPSILISVLAATSAFALQAVVKLDGKGVVHTTKFEEHGLPSIQKLRNSGPYNRVELDLDHGFRNQKLRCQLLNSAGRAILVDRGANQDKGSFGDGNGGPWTFPATRVSSVRCDARLAGFEEDEFDAGNTSYQEDEEWQDVLK